MESVRRSSPRTLVFGLALLVTLVAPCLCLAAPFASTSRNAHECCETTGEAMKAALPDCCPCLAPGNGDTVFERATDPGPAVPAVVATVAESEPLGPAVLAFRPAVPRAVSPPKTALLV
jgi:hypothetical protein